VSRAPPAWTRSGQRREGRPTVPSLAAAVLLAAALALAAPVRAAATAPPVAAVGCIGMTVSDLERSIAFYSGVLAFEKVAEEEAAGPAHEALTGVFALRTRTARVRLGAECLDLTEYLGPKGRPIPVEARSNDRSFQHVAIVVADTGASLRFYRDVLGLAVAGGSENHGEEQARLNGVEGAHLRITTLRAARGPGVELLEYVAPRDGRPYPPDARPNDLVHWQTSLLVPAVEDAQAVARGAGATLVSRGVAELPGSRLGLARAALVRDPDGHALLLAEPAPR
jgi:catechol 2,3-dioxygenase-like lactoylglutathione lyase family enzyme